jgi:hypothetical protein
MTPAVLSTFMYSPYPQTMESRHVRDVAESAGLDVVSFTWADHPRRGLACTTFIIVLGDISSVKAGEGADAEHINFATRHQNLTLSLDSSSAPSPSLHHPYHHRHSLRHSAHRAPRLPPQRQASSAHSTTQRRALPVSARLGSRVLPVGSRDSFPPAWSLCASRLSSNLTLIASMSASPKTHLSRNASPARGKPAAGTGSLLLPTGASSAQEEPRRGSTIQFLAHRNSSLPRGNPKPRAKRRLSSPPPPP